MERIRVAERIFHIDDYFISEHNRGKLINKEDWDEFEIAKRNYREALLKFKEVYNK